MQKSNFDEDAAQKNLKQRENKRSVAQEEFRSKLLQKTI